MDVQPSLTKKSDSVIHPRKVVGNIGNVDAMRTNR